MCCYRIFLECGFPDVSVVGRWNKDDISHTNARTLIGYLYDHASEVAAVDPGQGGDPEIESPIARCSVRILQKKCR